MHGLYSNDASIYDSAGRLSWWWCFRNRLAAALVPV